MRHTNGFTLVELLVVISIIVVLLALLAPALDKAIYQAQLTVCGANLNGIALGVTVYAHENNRLYPYRPVTDPALASTTDNAQRYPFDICRAGLDDRPYLRGHMSLENLVDPLTDKIDLQSPPNDVTRWVMSSYTLWFGVKFATWAGNGGAGIRRIGDRMAWTDYSRGQVLDNRFSVLASDKDFMLPAETNVWSGHPEIGTHILFLFTWRDHSDLGINFTFSKWASSGRYDRNPIDTNYAYADGSVARHNDVAWNDDRMARVPGMANIDWGVPLEDTTLYWHQLPPEQ